MHARVDFEGKTLLSELSDKTEPVTNRRQPAQFEMASARAKLNIGARMTNKEGERRDGWTGKRGLACGGGARNKGKACPSREQPARY